MCGIYGRIGKRNDRLDQRATASLHHRGPDAAGLWIDTQLHNDRVLALGHARLAIVDLSDAGRQPMLSADNNVVLVFNGEIYNFLTLRKRLEQAGRVFQSHSDTEVILHLYEEYGDDCVDRLAGMFTFCIWDARRGRALLARNRAARRLGRLTLRFSEFPCDIAKLTPTPTPTPPPRRAAPARAEFDCGSGGPMRSIAHAGEFTPDLHLIYT